MSIIRYLKRQFLRGEKKFLTGTESVKEAAEFGRPIAVAGKANVSKAREII